MSEQFKKVLEDMPSGATIRKSPIFTKLREMRNQAEQVIRGSSLPAEIKDVKMRLVDMALDSFQERHGATHAWVLDQFAMGDTQTVIGNLVVSDELVQARIAGPTAELTCLLSLIPREKRVQIMTSMMAEVLQSAEMAGGAKGHINECLKPVIWDHICTLPQLSEEQKEQLHAAFFGT